MNDLERVTLNPLYLEFVTNQTEEMCLIAIKKIPATYLYPIC
jgi:hypothetical protein